MKSLCFVTFALLFHGVTSDVSCSSGLYSEGSKGFVRCHFGRDVRQGKLQLLVVHCGNTACSPSSQRYPLACNIENGELDCTDALPGYTFVDQVDSSLTLVIPNVTEQTAGVYFCQVTPSDDSPIHNCTLTVTEPSPEPSLDQCPKCSCAHLAEILGVCLTVGVILLLALLFFGFRCTRKRFYLEKRVGNPQQDTCICCGFAYNVRRKPKHTHTVNVNSARSDTVVFTNEGESEKLLAHGNHPEPEVFIIQSRTQGVQSTSRPDAIVKVGVPEEGKKDDTDNQPGFEQQAHAAVFAASSSRESIAEGVDNDKRTTSDDSYNAEGGALAESIEQESGPMKALGYENWTTDQVCQWLTEEKASPALIKLMNEKGVTGSMLNATKKMKDVGITDKKERNELEGKIKTLKQKATKEEKAAAKEEKEERAAAEKAKKEAAKENKKKNK